jgi:hypothetical protein
LERTRRADPSVAGTEARFAHLFVLAASLMTARRSIGCSADNGNDEQHGPRPRTNGIAERRRRKA